MLPPHPAPAAGSSLTGAAAQRRGHQAKDQMQGQGAKERDPVDVAVEEFAAEGEEGAVEDQEEEGAVEVRVVHDVGGGGG